MPCLNDAAAPIAMLKGFDQEDDVTRIRLVALSSALCLAIGTAQAQPAANNPPTSGAAAPGPGPGPGMGPHMGGGMGPGGMGHGMRAGPGYTMGWSLMTPQERQENQAKMMSFTSAKECRAYVEQHHKLMTERAKQRGVAIPPNPMHDPCAGLKD